MSGFLEYIKRIWWLLLILFIAPIIVIATFFYQEFISNRIDLSAGEWAGLLGAAFGYWGTIILGALAFWQNEKANQINSNLLNMEKKRVRSFIDIQLYKNFSNYDSYESYLSDTVTCFLNEETERAIQHSLRNKMYVPKRLSGIEFSLVGESPVFDVSISISLKYIKNNTISTERMDVISKIASLDNYIEKTIDINIPLFNETSKYLQLMSFEQYYKYSVECVTINYKTQYENIRIKNQICNLDTVCNEYDKRSVGYYIVENSKEIPIMDDINYILVPRQKNTSAKSSG